MKCPFKKNVFVSTDIYGVQITKVDFGDCDGMECPAAEIYTNIYGTKEVNGCKLVKDK